MTVGGPEMTYQKGDFFPDCNFAQPAAVREAICLFGLKASNTGD